MADKLDLKKSLDAYQASEGQFRILEVPDLQYLMIDGHGDPNTSPHFAEALETLYPVAYASSSRASSRWTATTSSCRWRACGGPTTTPSS